MVDLRPSARIGFLFLLAAMVVAGSAASSLSQELAAPELSIASRGSGSPFAVAGSARKALPPLDCLGCEGPAPWAPCIGHHRGFLYYGTCHHDDDCVNGFDDCPGGNCGSIAVSLSRGWIELCNRTSRSFARHPSDAPCRSHDGRSAPCDP
ncbi:MAG: hypothetical protein ACYC6Y_18720 [Thermoguttaceae bacterium]